VKRSLAVLAFLVASAACPNAAAAQDAPIDLKGQWVGTSESIVRGKAMHHADPGPNPPLLDNVEFTFAITGQDGRRFWGTVSSTKTDAEPIMGVIAYDGKTIVASDSDGYLHGTIVDADTIELVYSHTGSSTVVAANRIKRQK
jgi:hypothetical protein